MRKNNPDRSRNRAGRRMSEEDIEAINLESILEEEMNRDGREESALGQESTAERKSTVEEQSEAAQRSAGKSPPGTRTRSGISGRNREFRIITGVFLALFFLLIAYLIYFQVFQSDATISSAYNSRLDLYAEHVIRGDILSADGELLATTEVASDGTQTRSYPYSRMFAHVVGYPNNGKGGIESQYNFDLLRSHSSLPRQVINDLRDEKNMGDRLVTTLDYDVQEAAYYAMDEDNGAVIVLEASTGKVLAMVSKPDFNPNTLEENWDSIMGDDSSTVLLNRATSGAYPPGSVFKIFTTLEYIHENSDYESYTYDCTGVLSVDGEEIHCYHDAAHGFEDLRDSFANSCNTSYANIGLTLNVSDFSSLAHKMLFDRSLPGSIPSAESNFSLSADDSVGKVMQTAIGQGDTTVSPLHMAIVAAAVDQDGIACTPYLADHIENENGTTVKNYHPSAYGSIMSESDASVLQDYMEAVVRYGTAAEMSGQSYQAAGKTGSAEYDSEGNSHGWFVGYGSKEGYSDIAIAVIVEGGGSGSQSAVPVAKQVFDVYFNQ